MPTPSPPTPGDLLLSIDRRGPVPLYFQVATALEAAIHDGTLPPGSRLENEIALGERLGLSRPTIRRAIQQLVDKGLLVRRRGIGTQVVHGRVTRPLELTSLYEDLASAGQQPDTRVLEVQHLCADAETAEALGVPKGTSVVRMRRLRSADGVPIAILDNTLPADVLDVPAAELERHGLYQLLRQRGVSMRIAKQSIGARAATHEEAELLDIDDGGPLITMVRTAFDSAGRAIEVGSHCYRPDRYSFEMTLVER